jgi:hypothetical protein
MYKVSACPTLEDPRALHLLAELKPDSVLNLRALTFLRDFFSLPRARWRTPGKVRVNEECRSYEMAWILFRLGWLFRDVRHEVAEQPIEFG